MFALHVFEAWVALLIFDGVSALGFDTVHRLVRRMPVLPRRRPRAAVETLCRAVDEACVWYFKRALCLQRSAVATWLLRLHGIRAELVIGYRPMPIESHAWTEVNGRIVNDRPQYQKFFTVLDRL